MTTAERIEKKTEVLNECIAVINRTMRHNGASVSTSTGITELAERIAEADIDRATLVMQDIATIDYVRNVLREFSPDLVGWVQVSEDRRAWTSHVPIFTTRPDKTTAEVSALANNDASLAVSEYIVTNKNNDKAVEPVESTIANRHDWAVVKLTPHGAEIVSCGGGFWQGYIAGTVFGDIEEEVTTTDPDTGEETTETQTYSRPIGTRYTQMGETGLLRKVLSKQEAAWMPEIWVGDLTGERETYTEGGIEFVQLPCALSGDLGQLISIVFHRRGGVGEVLPDVSYSLTDVSCDASNEGMLALPHGLWLIYDNTTLASAPQALLVPKSLVEDGLTGVEITYSKLVSGMERLRLVSGSFGDEYIISTQDLEWLEGGAWYE